MSSTAGSIFGGGKGTGLITVVRAERRGIFLHLLCYRNADLDAIDLLMDSLSGKLELLPPVDNELDIEGKLLAVKIGDSWLRACGQSNGLVNLIDVAVKKKVALENIRHALPEMQKPQITFWCILSNFFAHCGETQIEEVMQSMIVELRSLSKLVNKARFASFCKGDSMLELWLEEQKLGVSTSCSEQLKFFEIDSIDEVVLTSARQGSTESTLNKDDDLLEATRLLPTHVNLSATVVSAPKGAKLFCVVLDQHRALANLLPKCLAEAPPLTVLPTSGQGCVVNAPLHLGGGWTRGLVVSCNRLTVTVSLIDLDMAEIAVEVSQMRELPPPLNTIPPLVVSVKLAGSDRFTDSVKDAFLALVRDQELELKAVSKEDDFQTCTLTSPDGNILNLMCERLARTAYREESLQAGRQAMVQICSLKQSVTSSWSIYVQLVDRRPKMEAMQSKIDAYCKGRKGINNQHLFCGDAVFARWEGSDEENKWQRAVVLEHHGRSTNVLFVDTGLQGEVEDIRTADLQLVLGLEAQAIECYIKDAEINKYSAKVVKSLINKKVLMMEVLEVMANKKLIVSLMDPSTYPPSDIGQQIAILSTRCVSPAISVMSNSNASTNLPSVFDVADEVGTHLQFPYVTSTKTPSIDGRCSVNSVASSQADYFDAVLQRQRCGPFSKPGLPEMKSDPALKISPGSVVGAGYSADITGVRRKQLEYPDEVCPKRNRPDTPPLEPTKVIAFTPMVVYPTSKFNATLSWLVHPAKFYVQASCMLDGLEKMMEMIESLHPDKIPPMRAVVQGQPCLAKFEGAWYRAKVLSFMKDIVDVFFVDYGNVARVTLNSEVKPIVNVAITELQTIAIPCSLRGVSVGSQWTERQTAQLHKILDAQPFTVDVCGIWNDTFSVVIESNSKNINLDLNAPPQCLKVLNHVPLMKPQNQGTCIVSWFVNPSEFFLQPGEFQDKHQKLQNQCNNCFKGSSLMPKYVKEGRILLAKCNDGNYCRVAVKAVKEDRALIHLFDTGRTIACKFENLYQLPDQLQAVEKHAMQCSLFNIAPMPGPQWPKAGQCSLIDDFFKASSKLEFKVVGVENDIAQVSLQINGGDVGDLLVKSGVAKRIQEPKPLMAEPKVPTIVTPPRCFTLASSFCELPVIYVSDGESTKKLSYINAQLTQQMSQLDSVEVGDFFAVKFLMMPNGTPWHRAELLPNNKFFLVDSGVTISCPIAMKELPPSIMDIPSQVLKARLPIEPPKGAASFDSGTIDKLTQLVCGQNPSEVTCQVIGTSGDTLYLDLLTPNSERAATLLEKQQLLVSTLKSVFISHIDIPLTLYVQVNHEMVTWVQEQLEKPLQQLTKVTVGQICASEFDGCKYRAEVLNQKRVRFIDYGNEEDASTWWQLDPELAAIPPLCQLRYAKGTESLSEEVNTALEDLFDFEKEYVAVFEGEDGIVLFDDGQDLVDVAKKSAESNNNEDLQSLHETVKVEEVKAEPELEVAESEEPVVDSKVEEEVIEIVETLAELEVEEVEEGEIPASDLDETITSTHEVEPVLEEPEVIVEEPEVIFVEEIKMIVKEPEVIVEEIKEIVKEPKETVKKAKQPAGDTEFRPYYVSSFNSTLEFYVQPDRDAVEKLSEELSQQPDFPLADLAQDEMCAALSNHDGKWGRAQILSLRPPCGWFFDSGRESQIRSFKLLDKKHRYIDLLAKRCELKDSLTDVVFKEGQWIEAKIDEDGKVELKKELHWRKVVVTHYESHSEFYVRPAEDDPKIMEQHLKDGTEVLMVNIGMMYAAPNEHTGGWSRVRVTDIPISGCSVFYVDHGYYGKALKLKNLVPYCLTHPEIAKMCFLQPVPPPEDRERIKALLTAGVEIEVDGLRLGNTAQSVTVRIGGRTLQEILHQEDEKSESASVTNSDKETELRPEAVDFVPTRNWDAIGCRLVSKYVKRCEDDESKDICESLGSLLKKASEADALTQKGKNFLKESFSKSRTIKVELSPDCDSPKSSPPESDDYESEVPVDAGLIKSKQAFKLSPAKLIF